jgi:hypothetical protein
VIQNDKRKRKCALTFFKVALKSVKVNHSEDSASLKCNLTLTNHVKNYYESLFFLKIINEVYFICGTYKAWQTEKITNNFDLNMSLLLIATSKTLCVCINCQKYTLITKILVLIIWLTCIQGVIEIHGIILTTSYWLHVELRKNI